MPVSRRITEAFLHRSAPLPERTRRVLVLAAASDGGELTVLARAAGSTRARARRPRRPARRRDWCALRDGAAEFRHPARARGDLQRRLARGAPAGAPRARRRAPDRDADRRAWHLAVGRHRPRRAGVLRRSSRPPSARVSAAPTRPPRPRSSGRRGSLRTTAACDRLLYAAADAAWLAGAVDRAAALVDEVRRADPQRRPRGARRAPPRASCSYAADR